MAQGFKYFTTRQEAVDYARERSKTEGRCYIDYGVCGWFACDKVPLLETQWCRCFENGEEGFA